MKTMCLRKSSEILYIKKFEPFSCIGEVKSYKVDPIIDNNLKFFNELMSIENVMLSNADDFFFLLGLKNG